MHRLRLMAIALVAMFALGAVVSATASAENPEILPVPTKEKPLKFTSENLKTNPTVTTTSGLTTSCTTLKNKGEFTSQDEGTITFDFEGCKSSGVSCNTAGDAKGTYLITRPIFLTAFKEGATLLLGVGVNFLKETIKIVCGSLLTVELKGDLLGKVDNITSLVKTKSVVALFDQTKNGEQAITKCELLKATCGSELKLESSFGKGFELAAESGINDDITFEKEVEVHF